MAIIGTALGKLRKDAGLSYRKLAAQVGISHNNLAEYERNEFGPSLENAVKIARFFNVSIEYLMYGEQADMQYRDIDLLALFGKVDDLPAEYRKMVKDYIMKILAHHRERELLEQESHLFQENSD